MEKEFKIFDEQMNLLKERGLKITNPSKFKWYIKSYNYQHFVNGYNDAFLINYSRASNRYRENVSDSSIVDLFNFDRHLSSLMFSNIRSIEMAFNSAVTHEIARELNNIKIPYGRILYVFQDNNLYTQIFKDIDNKIKTKEILLYNFNKNKIHPIHKKYNKSKSQLIPIWSLSIFWTFGDTLKIFNMLSKNIKKRILEKYYYDKFDTTDDLQKSMFWLKVIRNIICHGNVLYKTATTNNSVTFFKVLGCDVSINAEIRIFDVVRMIDHIDGVTCYEKSLMYQFDKLFDYYLIDKRHIPIDSITYIMQMMNYKSNSAH